MDFQQLNLPAVYEYAQTCSLAWFCEFSTERMIIGPRGNKDAACWVIKVSLKSLLGLVLDPQGFRAARFPQLLRAALMICNPLSDWPKALIRISIPAAPGAWAGHPPIPRARLLGYNTEI